VITVRIFGTHVVWDSVVIIVATVIVITDIVECGVI